MDSNIGPIASGGMLDELKHRITAALFVELSDAGFEWWEYPTLIDAMERHVVAGLWEAATQCHITFSDPSAVVIDA